MEVNIEQISAVVNRVYRSFETIEFMIAAEADLSCRKTHSYLSIAIEDLRREISKAKYALCTQNIGTTKF
ncbi:MAG TPA: hypothetical protein V6D15_17960 [Oculatellaceae cyanobacterium]|jgi:hypothetical protein